MKYTILLMSLLLAVYCPISEGVCTCRAKNVVASEGEVVCVQTANGGRIARCEKVLNNTSWKFLPGSCSPDAT